MNKEGRPLGHQSGSHPGPVDPIWQVIRAVRLERDMSVSDLAKRAGVAPSTISRAERGFHVWLDRTRMVADALGIAIFTAVISTTEDESERQAA